MRKTKRMGKRVKLWIDDSSESKVLRKSFEDKNYQVEHILTASPLPIAKINSSYFSGIGCIRTLVAGI